MGVLKIPHLEKEKNFGVLTDSLYQFLAWQRTLPKSLPWIYPAGQLCPSHSRGWAWPRVTVLVLWSLLPLP